MSIRASFVAAVVLALSAGSALAQPVEERPAPIKDDQPPTGTPEGKAAEHEGEHHHPDPSKHFRFFGSPTSHYGKDEMGGKFGDGVMIDEKTGEVEHEEEPMSPPFIFMLLNFAVLLGLLAWKGKPAAQKLAADRHDQIKTALDEAAKLRKQAADKLASYETRIKDADAEITRLIEGMRLDAEADKKRILDAAERQAAQMKKDAEQRIAAEIEYARAALTREVTVAAAAATEKLLREKMTAADQQKVVSSFIAGVQAAAGKEAR